MDDKQSAKEQKKQLPKTPLKNEEQAPKMNYHQNVVETVVNLADPATTIEGIKVNIGSGVDYKKGYLNVDKYDSSADLKADICDLPFNDNTIAMFTCYEVLEHLNIYEVQKALKEIHRTLKPNGSLHATVPYIVDACKKVIENPEDDWALATIYGNQEHEGQYHKNGFTPKRLFKLCGYAGFRIVKTAWINASANSVVNIYLEAVK